MSAHSDDGKGPQGSETLRVLAVSDEIEPQLYNASLRDWLGHVDLIVSCGDLPSNYLDFLVSNLRAPMYHVLGNHCFAPHDPITGRCSPAAYPGLDNLNGKLAYLDGLLLGGAEGSPWYNGGPHQYNEQQIEVTLLRMVPGMLINKVRSGRYLDVLVTHAPPAGIYDYTDVAHRGFASLNQFVDLFKPSLLLHGHTHRYNPMMPMHTRYGSTDIINCYGHVVFELKKESESKGWRVNVPEWMRGAHGRSTVR
jgi:hypothetical protein